MFLDMSHSRLSRDPCSTAHQVSAKMLEPVNQGGNSSTWFIKTHRPHASTNPFKLLIGFHHRGAMPPKKRKLAASEEEEEHHHNLYEILQVDRRASHRQLVQAYHRQALVLHPDKGGDAGRFQKLAHAYEVLTDNNARDAYHMSLLEHGCSDGLANHAMDVDTNSSSVHMLADLPRDFLRVLLAANPQHWRHLLLGFRGDQLAKLLECLDVNKNRYLPRAEHNHLEQDCTEITKFEALPRMKHLVCRLLKDGTYDYSAKFVMGGFEVSAPRTCLPVVAAYYHAATVEMRRCIVDALRAQSGCAMKAALLHAVNLLGSRGFSCPFVFRSRRRLDAKDRFTPCVDDLALALNFHDELKGLTTLAAFNRAKKKWEKTLGQELEALRAGRKEKALELKGYILAQQDACGMLRFRRQGKQPSDLRLKVPLLGNLAARLGQTAAQLEASLATSDGQKALMDFFEAKRKVAVALKDLVGWDHVPESQKAWTFTFVAIVDLSRFGSASRTCRAYVQSHMHARLGHEAILRAQDFGTSGQVVRFVQQDFLQNTEVLDLREMPSDVMADDLFWRHLRTLRRLGRVVVDGSHAALPPQYLAFSVHVSLSKSHAIPN